MPSAPCLLLGRVSRNTSQHARKAVPRTEKRGFRAQKWLPYLSNRLCSTAWVATHNESCVRSQVMLSLHKKSQVKVGPGTSRLEDREIATFPQSSLCHSLIDRFPDQQRLRVLEPYPQLVPRLQVKANLPMTSYWQFWVKLHARHCHRCCLRKSLWKCLRRPR